MIRTECSNTDPPISGQAPPGAKESNTVRALRRLIFPSPTPAYSEPGPAVTQHLPRKVCTGVRMMTPIYNVPEAPASTSAVELLVPASPSFPFNCACLNHSWTELIPGHTVDAAPDTGKCKVVKLGGVNNTYVYIRNTKIPR